MYWNVEARRIVRAELARRDVSYMMLARLLGKEDIEETEKSLANKISRGTFSFVFFLQVMRVLGVKNVVIEPTERVPGIPFSGEQVVSPPKPKS
jgi:hypothetical protein